RQPPWPSCCLFCRSPCSGRSTYSKDGARVVQHNGVVVQHNGVVGWASKTRPTTSRRVGLEDSAHPTATATAPTIQVNAAHRTEPWWVRWGLTLAAIAVLTLLVIVPVANVFYQALSRGVAVYWQNLIGDSNTRHA